VHPGTGVLAFFADLAVLLIFFTKFAEKKVLGMTGFQRLSILAQYLDDTIGRLFIEVQQLTGFEPKGFKFPAVDYTR
jgi:hypothetical protein